MLFERDNCTVIDTAEESANGKWSSVCAGYYNDKYIIYMTGIRNKNLPHQNLGYFLRHNLVHNAILKFYSIYKCKSQVVVIGCGYDTMFWNCYDEDIRFQKWFELDKEELIAKKSKIISDNKLLQKYANQDSFVLMSIDFDTIKSLLVELKKNRFDEKIPTLFIDEFSMIYFETETTKNILREIGNLDNSCIISYGMTLVDDEYGSFVREGFEDIGIPLKSYILTSTENDYKQLLIDSGFECSKTMNCNSMIKYYFDEKEKKRIIHLEHFDNLKEVLYYMKHYCGAVGGNNEFVSIIPTLAK